MPMRRDRSGSRRDVRFVLRTDTNVRSVRQDVRAPGSHGATIHATSNHEGHQGTQRNCALWCFPFVHFVSLAVKPLCSNHEGHQGIRRNCALWCFPFVHFASLAMKPMCSDHEGHQGIRRTCASWFFPFVHFVSLAVKPSMTSPQQATTKGTKGHKGNALHF